jgi:hypothetical protein
MSGHYQQTALPSPPALPEDTQDSLSTRREPPVQPPRSQVRVFKQVVINPEHLSNPKKGPE